MKMHFKCKTGRHGFTLAEILIALSIAVVIAAAFTQLNLGTARTLFDSRAKLDTARDVRAFTSEFSRSAKGARQFYIFPNASTTPSPINIVPDGGSGDMVVFVFTEPEDLAVPNSDVHITRIIAYIRDAEIGEAGPVVRIEQTYSIASGVGRHSSMDPSITRVTAQAMITNLLADTSADRREVLELSRGFANGRLFLNFRGRSVVINGEIMHGNLARRVTNTYNFTVSPRG